MLRISKLTDYGTLVLVHLARYDAGQLCPASDVAAGTRLALPTVQKVLKTLANGGLVESARGAEGGYRLVRRPEEITAAEILEVLEGPFGITECSDASGGCELEDDCMVGGAWQKISKAIQQNPPAEFPLRYTILRKSGHSDRLANTNEHSGK
jgi:FeS assembly SUF system regulator